MNPIGDVCYWRDPDLAGIETCLVRASRHVFPKHAHDDLYAFAMMEVGGSYCLGPGRDDCLVVPGRIALINPAQVHSGVPANRMPVTYRMIYMDTGRMSALAGDVAEKPGLMPELRQIVTRDPALLQLLRRVCSLIISGGDRMEKESAVVSAVAALLSRYTADPAVAVGRGAGNRLIRQAKEYLAEHLDEKVSLEDAAGAVGLSRYHFLRLFKRETGVPPHLFRTQRRIDRARQLLKDGMPFAQVALETGFTDQSHFSNKFKQLTGATPRQYAAGSRKSNFLQYTPPPMR